MERARAADAQAIGHLRHVQPLLAAPLLAQVGSQLGIGDGRQAHHVLVFRACQPVPEIRAVDHVKPAAPRLVDDRWERHVTYPISDSLITDTEQLAHRSRREQLRACTANDRAVTAQGA